MSEKILVFATGTIGDMITAFPAMQRIREHHKDAEIHLYNSRFCKNDIHTTLFQHLNFFDKMIFQQVPEKLYQKPWKRLLNWFMIYREHYDIIYELPCNTLTPKVMMKSFGAGKLYSPDILEPNGVPRFRFLLDFLSDCGIPRKDGDETVNWNFQPEEIRNAEKWFAKIQIPDGYIPFVMCTGGKSPLQHWPLDRYAEVLKKIVPEHKLFPVFVGSPADAADAEYLKKECGLGIFSQDIGNISLREMIIAFKHFKFYLGNDTGILHIAGASGIPSLAISSARDPFAYWTPLNGDKHFSIVADVVCRNCRKNQCSEQSIPICIEKISVYELVDQLNFLLKLLEM